MTGTFVAYPTEEFRPDRREVINIPGQHRPVVLAPGVYLDCLVGGHNAARNLTTGLVVFDPGARLPCHKHPVSESISVLAGALRVSVEGREYCLGTLDNIVIPGGIPHSAQNASTLEPVRLHSALASDAPSREPVPEHFTQHTMRGVSAGIPGKERVTRFKDAPRSSAGPGTSFIDYFNEDLMPGLEMSGGYGLFQPGGRLPAHLHDFDESICIIGGVATCLVEGRRYQMRDGATALQPRGRLHYFVNEGDERMEMIWMYAGPTPERILVEDHFATSDCNPWNE